MQTKPFRIGTRGSPLALAQAQEARDRLIRAHGLDASGFEIVVISTKGDRITDRPLSEVGGKGLFTEEIEVQLSDGRLDIAVHSSKDMPTELPEGLHLSAFLPREDCRDAFIGGTSATLEGLRPGAVVGSSSLRRAAMVRRLRPDISVVSFRGNVQTRLRKLAEGSVDATLLAMAGLRRLGLEAHATEVLEAERFLPALGQGAICIESRVGDVATDAMLAAINDADTMAALACERAFLAVLDGSCRTPIAGLASIDGARLHFRGMVLSPDGASSCETSLEGAVTEADALGREAGNKIRADAGSELFDSWA